MELWIIIELETNFILYALYIFFESHYQINQWNYRPHVMYVFTIL